MDYIKQKKIWDHFQNEGMYTFDGARPRYQYIAQRIQPKSVVLNVGVGNGGLEALLVEKGMTVYCLDPSERAIERIQKLLNLGEQAKIGFSQDMPFENGIFDKVIMSEVLEHLEEDILRSTLKEVFRVLKTTGSFIGTVPANEVLSSNHVTCPYCDNHFHRWGHLQSFSIETLINLLEQNNFVKIKAKYTAFPDWEKRGVLNYVKNSIRFFLGKKGNYISSPHIFFEAKKS
jgi:SAM-dependent methyltransferase